MALAGRRYFRAALSPASARPTSCRSRAPCHSKPGSSAGPLTANSPTAAQLLKAVEGGPSRRSQSAAAFRDALLALPKKDG
jgi:hypothetical protein